MQRAVIYDDMPSLPIQYIRAILPGRKAIHKNTSPVGLSATTRRPISIEPVELESYLDVCGIPAANYLPITYLQVLAAPLHASIIASPMFPFPALGLIHISNTIVQHRPIGVREWFFLRAELIVMRDVDRGMEFEIQTIASSQEDSEPIWESTMTILVQTKKKTGRKSSKKHDDNGGFDPGIYRCVSIRIPENIGRIYAGVSGDFNPIHLHKSTARLMGFKNAIAHGMWTLARCVGELYDDIGEKEMSTLTVKYRRPVFLPSTVVLTSMRYNEAARTKFRLTSSDGNIIHLEGSWH